VGGVRQAVILAGGLGTRLRAALPDLPKTLAPVAGRAFVEYLLLQLRKHHVPEVILSVGYRADLIEEHVGDGRRWGVRARYAREAEPLGTGGALKRAEALLEGSTFLVMNGDSFFDIPLGELAAAHRTATALGTLALVDRPDADGRYGAVETDEAGRVVRFREKGSLGPGHGFNGGIYVLEPELLAGIPEGRPVSLEREVFPGLGGRLRGRPYDGYFVDIGVPEDYEQVQRDASLLDRAIS
jgi:NDP-sugar pyrophosphorylase family protein